MNLFHIDFCFHVHSSCGKIEKRERERERKLEGKCQNSSFVFFHPLALCSFFFSINQSLRRKDSSWAPFCSGIYASFTIFADTMVCTGCCSTLDHIVSYIFKQLANKGKEIVRDFSNGKKSVLLDERVHHLEFFSKSRIYFYFVVSILNYYLKA